jgi:hypothetical protein
METELLHTPAARLFAREPTPTESREQLMVALEDERARRARVERVSSDLARMVARESRRAEDERARRIEAEKVADGMAALVAHENARAERAERNLRELLRY